ncbi:hypothetical protein GJ744_010443 [Endocarpon pusillum]|uniref:Uncharacterized protein n=1 Tax=Endocarpon pusillum TaxID=364733 RepID=A0A8H7AGL9_9EURO|nr:hypothetical protein GJ744_010443 [Endocarpon pusillum]
MVKRRQNAVVTTLRDTLGRDVTASSIPHPVGQAEIRSAADDGVTNAEQVTGAAGGDAGPSNFLKEVIENGPASQSTQESDGQETETEDLKPRCVSTSASDFHSESATALTRHPPPPPPITIEAAIQSNSGAVTRGADVRKRALSFIQPPVPFDDGAPCKRPYHVMKETWKAREGIKQRETLEKFKVKPSRTFLNPQRKETDCLPLCLRGGLDSSSLTSARTSLYLARFLISVASFPFPVSASDDASESPPPALILASRSKLRFQFPS